MRNLRKAFSSSSTPTNNPPDTPAPPIAEYIKQQLAVFLPGKKDRTLVASSSAIAVSTGIGTLPQSSDLTDPVPDEPESSRESAWRAAYGAAKIAVDIAKDSSDILPPLKAVMVALSVLIKNYDVSPVPIIPSDWVLTVSCSKPPQMRISSEESRKGFNRLARYSNTLLMTETAMRRRGERRSRGLCYPLEKRRDISSRIRCQQEAGWDHRKA